MPRWKGKTLYLIIENNGEDFPEDYHEFIGDVYTNFRDTSLALIKEGYNPAWDYYAKDIIFVRYDNNGENIPKIKEITLWEWRM